MQIQAGGVNGNEVVKITKPGPKSLGFLNITRGTSKEVPLCCARYVFKLGFIMQM